MSTVLWLGLLTFSLILLNHCNRWAAVVSMRKASNLSDSLAFLRRIGFCYRHLWGSWYFVWRRKE